MSAEALKRRLIPLIQRGYYDDVRCEILIHLKENPHDEEVWHWCVATARSDEDRLRALKQWLKVNPRSARARRLYEKLARRHPNTLPPLQFQPLAGSETRGMEEGYVRLPELAPAIRRLRFGDAPFGAAEFIRTLFVGQESLVVEVAALAEGARNGRHANLMLRAPSGHGKTLLASLTLNYLDPRNTRSLVLEGRAVQHQTPLGERRFVLIEEFFDIPSPDLLLPLLKSGEHTFLFTTRSRAPLPQPIAACVRVLTFGEYTLGELGLVAQQRLARKNISIPLPFMHQIAKYAHGNPEIAASYAERLSLVWRRQEVSGSLGELIYHLNYTLRKQPPEPQANYIAIWDDELIASISADEILAGLQRRNFPFGLNIPVPQRSLQLTPPERRMVQLDQQLVSLPPYLFKQRFNPAGLVADALGSARPRGLVLGAYSEVELYELVEMCGFVVRDEITAWRDEDPLQAIPDDVQLAVWKRDRGRCVLCGSRENLGFDLLIPASRGGSNTARNVRVLCEQCFQARHMDY